MTVDVRREARQERRLLERRVAAADDGDRLAAEEEPVAGRAGRDAVAHQRPLRRQPQQPRRGAGRHDDASAPRTTPSSVVTVNGADFEIDGGHVAATHLGAEPLGLRAHVGHQIRPHDAVPETGKVLDGRRHHELTAGLEALDDERREVRARRVERGRESGRTGPDDDDVTNGLGHENRNAPSRTDAQRCLSTICLSVLLSTRPTT